ncbi:MAG TPA: hypothetical protein VHF25_08555, partial [Nitriliruptorales bacterium]|nr:hypothetical protein [Nitriliruptorales bacterium]
MDLSAELEPSELLVQPGEMARAELRLRNRGDHPAALSLQVADVDVDWIWTNPTALKVAPGGEARVQVSLRPPRGADPPAGPMTVALRALPAGVLHQPVEATLTLEVAPVADLIASMRPRISSGRWRARHTVSVHNRGNVALHVGLAPASSGDVVVEMRPAAVEVDPGEVGEATLWVRGRWPRLLRPVERPVAVEVDAGTTATRVTATFVQGPVLRGWQRWVAVGLVVLGPVVLGLRALGPSGIPSEFVADDASGPANDDGSGAAVGAGDVPAVDPDCP